MTEPARAGRIPLPDLDVPVVGAPMAGVSTPALAAAVSEAGGLGFLAAGYRTPGQLSADISETRNLTARPFGVNVFVPGPPLAGVDLLVAERLVRGYADRLRRESVALDTELPDPRWDDTDDWDTKLALLADIESVAVVSLTFGCPPPDAVDRLHRAGSSVALTVTSRAEGEAAAAAGADVLIVQGFDAGGHRGTHRVADEPNELDHLALLPILADLGLPMVAAGGITTAGDTRRALAAGAVAVQVGTALLLTDEAGTTAAHRMGLTDPHLRSVITRAFSGRPARGLANRFVIEHDGAAPQVFPQVDQLTKPLRAAAARRADLGGVSLWAGSGWRAAREEPAATTVARLSSPAPPGGKRASGAGRD